MWNWSISWFPIKLKETLPGYLKKITFWYTAKLEMLSSQLHMENLTLQDVNIKCLLRHLGPAKGGCSNKAEECKVPSTNNMHVILKSTQLKRAVKSFSVTTHLYRGIIIKIRKSLRWGTTYSMKLSALPIDFIVYSFFIPSVFSLLPPFQGQSFLI